MIRWQSGPHSLSAALLPITQLKSHSNCCFDAGSRCSSPPCTVLLPVVCTCSPLLHFRAGKGQTWTSMVSHMVSKLNNMLRSDLKMAVMILFLLSLHFLCKNSLKKTQIQLVFIQIVMTLKWLYCLLFPKYHHDIFIGYEYLFIVFLWYLHRNTLSMQLYLLWEWHTDQKQNLH